MKKIGLVLLGVILIGLGVVYFQYNRTMSIIDEAIEERGWDENIESVESGLGTFDKSIGSFSKFVTYEDEPDVTYRYNVLDFGNKELSSSALRNGVSTTNAKYIIE